MPIYEYHCAGCNHDFEYLVFGSDKPVCPTCNSTDVNKLISSCGFVSKGKGGETSRTSAGSSCTSCSSSSCSSCH